MKLTTSRDPLPSCFGGGVIDGSVFVFRVPGSSRNNGFLIVHYFIIGEGTKKEVFSINFCDDSCEEILVTVEKFSFFNWSLEGVKKHSLTSTSRWDGTLLIEKVNLVRKYERVLLPATLFFAVMITMTRATLWHRRDLGYNAPLPANYDSLAEQACFNYANGDARQRDTREFYFCTTIFGPGRGKLF